MTPDELTRPPTKEQNVTLFLLLSATATALSMITKEKSPMGRVCF